MINAVLPPEEWMRPPGLITSSHILKQKPPSKLAKPSVMLQKKYDAPPMITAVMTMATRYAPWMASLVEGFASWKDLAYRALP